MLLALLKESDIILSDDIIEAIIDKVWLKMAARVKIYAMMFSLSIPFTP
jgi:hypothetical protein